ncbi:folate-binding protein [Hydrogenovibrio sp. SC-1]|uniref:CAF17-like 4Fe-4S cluster assembly/insertion protein YgfZ n=1 Tax=Hydrogenovibrio sp. SC-1 TaxID=2065820 RepID=UPI000C7A309C|nr:folate-binding protein YgfZ [Hydrogenovibrio sp. SC-1]PLA74978.1 folate-binding protein [Hydrogenovibrio sp. SC-1]
MNADWKSFLTELGAQFNDQNEITTFGQPDIERFMIKNGPVIASLAHQALIKVSGQDAFTFLQGQLSNDLSQVTDHQAQLTSYCEPQGKVLATLTIFKQNDNFYLTFDGSLAETIFKRLNMFKMRSDVSLENLSDEWVQMAYAGEFADLDVQRLLSTKIKNTYEVQPLESADLSNITAVKIPGPYHCYQFFGPVEQCKLLWQQLKNNGEYTNNQDWKLTQIVSGQPQVNHATSNEFIAQFLNLDKLNAISFKKGCFPGQETIAKMHYRGKVTKRMLRLRFEESVALESGESFKLIDEADRNYKFTTILSAEDIMKGSICLAVTTLKPLETAQGQLKTESGIEANLEPLPYPITDEE